MANVIIPLPKQDFDPTEVAVSWQVLTGMGHAVYFATVDGKRATADQIMLDGVGLDPWGRVPGLRRLPLIGLLLRANRDARAAYMAMAASKAFFAPLHWDEVGTAAFDGIVLPGGHRARGMRPYLESTLLQQRIANFFAAGRPVAAICHGVLLAARSIGADGRSVLHGRKTTALTWRLEKAADGAARIGRWWDRDYYRTYPDGEGQPRGHMSVEQEVTRALASPGDFIDVPKNAPDYRRKTDGLHRDTAADARPAWVVVDGNYVSARWPGDAHTFAATFGRLLA